MRRRPPRLPAGGHFWSRERIAPRRSSCFHRIIAACYDKGWGLEEIARRIAWYDQLEKLRTEFVADDREMPRQRT